MFPSKYSSFQTEFQMKYDGIDSAFQFWPFFFLPLKLFYLLDNQKRTYGYNLFYSQ